MLTSHPAFPQAGPSFGLRTLCNNPISHWVPSWRRENDIARRACFGLSLARPGSMSDSREWSARLSVARDAKETRYQFPIPPLHRVVTGLFTAVLARLALLLVGLYWIPVDVVARKRG